MGFYCVYGANTRLISYSSSSSTNLTLLSNWGSVYSSAAHSSQIHNSCQPIPTISELPLTGYNVTL